MKDMPTFFPAKYKKITGAIILICLVSFPLFAYEQTPDMQNQGYVESKRIPETKKGTVIFGECPLNKPAPYYTPVDERNLTQLQKTARAYRTQGFANQRLGDFDSAFSYYQKAIQLDPAYAVAYNDLGVIYESRNQMDNAQECYLKAIQIDPTYLSAYTNLALIYEDKRELTKAHEYWSKRVELGSPTDPWTTKAKDRLSDIRLVLQGGTVEQKRREREQEIASLMMDVSKQKGLLREDNKELSKYTFEKARIIFDKGDELTALKYAVDAGHLDPTNKEIAKFIEKVQKRLLSK
ncbi:MAG: tetratricopeptide repeat protein [Candidatus Omnitrophota bacterium]